MTFALLGVALQLLGGVPNTSVQQPPPAHTIHLPVAMRPHRPVEIGTLADTLGGNAPAWTGYPTSAGGEVPNGYVLGAGRKLIVVAGSSTWTVGLRGRVLALTTDVQNGNIVALEAQSDEVAGAAPLIHIFRPDPARGLVELGAGQAPRGSFDLRSNGGWLFVATRGATELPAGIAVLDARAPEAPWGEGGFHSLGGHVPEDIELAPAFDGLYATVRASDGSPDVRLSSWLVGGRPPTLSPRGSLPLEDPPTGRAMLAAAFPWIQVVGAAGPWAWYDPADGPVPSGEPVVPRTACLGRVVDVASIAAGPLPSFAAYGEGCVEWRVLIDGAWEVDRSATDDRAYEVSTSGSPFHETEGRLGMAYGASGGFFDWTGVPGTALELPGSAVCMSAVGGEIAVVAGDGFWVLSPGAPEPTQRGMTRLGYTPPSRCEIAVSGNTAYLSADDLFTQVELADRSRPSASRASRLPRTIGALAADGRRSYIAAGADGLFVRPHRTEDPIAGGAVRTAGTAWDAELAAGHLYVADGIAGVSVFELEGDALPRHVGTQPAGVDIRALRAEGPWLYATAARGDGHRLRLGDITLLVFDISQPLKPEIVGWLDLPGSSPGRPALGPAGVLVPAGNALHLVDVSSPQRPLWTRTIRTPAQDAAGAARIEMAALGDLGVGISVP